MKKIHIKVSQQNLTRCRSCSRHHAIDRVLSGAELLLLSCDFCGEQLIGDQSRKPHQLRVTGLGARSSKLAMGLLGAGLLLGGCDDDETVEPNGGSTAGAMTAGVMTAGTAAGVEIAGTPEAGVQDVYGAPPAGIEEAGSPGDQPLYGAFPAGSEEEAGVEMAGTPEAGMQDAYGAPPAGEEG